MDDCDRALEAHLFDRRHERRVEGLGLAPEFWGGCAGSWLSARTKPA